MDTFPTTADQQPYATRITHMFLVIGTTTIDLFLTGLEHMPAAEADEFTTDNFAFCDEPLRMVLGGNAGSAVSLARLGAEVAVSSAVGADRLGALARQWHAEAGVEVSTLVEVESAATSTTTILSDEALNRRSFHHPGATLVFTPSDLDDARLEAADALLVSGYPLLERWRPGGVRRALEIASQSGAMTALDLGPAIGDPARTEELDPLLPSVDYLFCNAHELAVCAGGRETVEAANRLLAAGTRQVAVKRGADGATLHRSGAEPLDAPGFAVETRFTVGAGDAFNAGVLLGARQEWAPGRALRFGNAVAAGVVENARGVLGTPARAEAERLL